MAFRIGFTAANEAENCPDQTRTVCADETEPRRSVVRVEFPGSGRELNYYNDRFDLHVGDYVFVEGKLAGLRGRVVEVNENFYIRLSDYKRVIAVADTKVHGSFFFAGSHFVTFERSVLPAERAASWFLPPDSGEEIVSGEGNAAFALNNLGQMNADGAVFERGESYYMENRVRYFCLDGECGYAIIEGSRPYEVRFRYRSGTVSTITCTCFCCGVCKHEVAAMLQLRETLDTVSERYGREYEVSGYLAAVAKGTLFSFVIDRRKTGSFTL